MQDDPTKEESYDINWPHNCREQKPEVEPRASPLEHIAQEAKATEQEEQYDPDYVLPTLELVSEVGVRTAKALGNGAVTAFKSSARFCYALGFVSLMPYFIPSFVQGFRGKHSKLTQLDKKIQNIIGDVGDDPLTGVGIVSGALGLIAQACTYWMITVETIQYQNGSIGLEWDTPEILLILLATNALSGAYELARVGAKASYNKVQSIKQELTQKYHNKYNPKEEKQ